MRQTDLELTVADLMTLEPVVVAFDAPIEDAHKLILEFGVSGLPVVDESGSQVGVVSQTDFMYLDAPDGVPSFIASQAESGSARS